jgi:small-conductance mechanosensitive channel
MGYLIYMLAGLLMLNAIGFEITYLLAGSAALFVGLGFGLQATFNDFVSGIIILFAGTIEVGDVVEVEGLVCKVKSIGMRSTQVITRNAITVIIPNAKFTHENVVNWSHSQSHTRFIIQVGVAYGTEVSLVQELLIAAAIDHEQVLKDPQPRARLSEFGSSSLDFELLFWTREPFQVEFTEGDIRKRIVELFTINGVVIPFPQRDIHLVSDLRG